jgi:hypothetical protein
MRLHKIIKLIPRELALAHFVLLLIDHEAVFL